MTQHEAAFSVSIIKASGFVSAASQILADLRCENLLCSQVTYNEENKEVKIIEPRKIMVTKSKGKVHRLLHRGKPQASQSWNLIFFNI